MNPEEIKIRDIKPLLEIHDQSIYYFYALIIISLVIVVGGTYLLFRWLKHRKRHNERKVTYAKLLHVNLQEPKEAAYAITKYGHLFSHDSERTLEMYHNLTSRLEQYKYKKEVASLDEETKSYFELYKGMIDV